MRTFAVSFPGNLTRIDRLSLPDHPYLGKDDRCAFLGEYTAHKGFDHSETNQLIFNLKKKMDRRGEAEWKHKKKAILEAAAALRSAIRN